MKIYLNTVSELLWETLNKLMNLEEFNVFRLVGGTSLSLQIGHRESVDIDLFTDEEYGSINFDRLEKTLYENFDHVESLYKGTVGMGKSYYIGKSSKELIKLDLFYTDPFIRKPIIHNKIRFATIEEIITMKLEVIAQGGRKKDFWDLHELLQQFSIQEMIYVYLERYPYNHSEKEIRAKLLDFSVANDDFLPNCYKDKIWEFIKLDFEEKLTE